MILNDRADPYESSGVRLIAASHEIIMEKELNQSVNSSALRF